MDFPGIGGHGCIAKMSFKKSRKTGRYFIYSPAALGMYRPGDFDSLYELVVRRKVSIVSIRGNGLEKDGIRIEFRNLTKNRLRVVVPKGLILEQQESFDVQNILVKERVEKTVEPGVNTLLAWGLCMDEDDDAPNGEELLLTPWIINVGEFDQEQIQEQIWKITEH